MLIVVLFTLMLVMVLTLTLIVTVAVSFVAWCRSRSVGKTAGQNREARNGDSYRDDLEANEMAHDQLPMQALNQ